MKTNKKPTKAGSDFMSAAELMRHAAALIQFDRDNALSIQSPIEPTHVVQRSSSLEASFGKTGQVAVKIKSDSDDAKGTNDEHKITQIFKKKESGQ